MCVQRSSCKALVTGAGHGIGLEVCRQFARQGMTVILGARDLEKAKTAARQMAEEAGEVHAQELDITDDGSVEAVRHHAEAELGGLDILVNNTASGFDPGDKAVDGNFVLARVALETNLFGTWRMARAFAPLLAKSGQACVVNVSSGSGSFGDTELGLIAGGSDIPAYSISKAALNALTVKLAADLKEAGILVNAVCPGLTATWPGAEAMGARPVSEGAAGIVWAATLPKGGPSGGLFRDMKPLPW